ncbi:Gfo/Idh/MocA family protein [Alkalitalea saponilacus]|nr:Gfo/Idh/MocA family oxidoreductase [Alkalitalea saponilacus]ASB49360.1 oxidoreductase [Alkalitalea saponilacus]
MANQKIKMGMIGGGTGAFIGDTHRKSALSSGQFELIGGIFSSDNSRSLEFARKEGFDLKRCYKNVEELIAGETALSEEERMQLIAVVTPNASHFPIIKELIAHQFHVMCEKPMTLNVDEAKVIEDLVRDNDITFALAHTYTGYPMVRQMRALVEKGLLGEIQRIDAQYYQGWINSIIHGNETRIKGVWRLNPEVAGASCCMGDIGVHAFNLIEYITGLNVQEVLADLNTIREDISLDLDGTVLLRFTEKLKGVIRATQVAGGVENDLNIGIYGSKASLKWSQENPNHLYLLTDNEPARIYKPGNSYNSDLCELGQTMPAGHPEGIYEALANIYKGIAKSIRKEQFAHGEFPTVHDGVRGMQFIHAVIKSNRTNNTWVNIEN